MPPQGGLNLSPPMNTQDLPASPFPKSKAQLNREKYAAQAAASLVAAKAPRRIRERRPRMGFPTVGRNARR